MSDVVTVSPQETRVEPVKASSPSWFIARINAVSRIIGALLECIILTVNNTFIDAGGIWVVPEFLRTLVFARPRGDDQFADCTFSPSLDMSR